MAAKRLVIVGAGGFAREVRWLVEEINRSAPAPAFEFCGYVASDLQRLGKHDSTSDVRGDLGWLADNLAGVDAAAIGIGTPGPRLALARHMRERFPSLTWPALVHPNVVLDRESCSLGEGVLLCANVVGTVNVTLAPFAMVNLNCTIGHEAVIGAGTVLNPTVNISGGVVLGDGVLVGTGAQILQYVTVENGATVGAGAVVTKNVESGQTVVGIPAKPLPRR